ncbi:hypothetical protein BofuT4_P041360.1 [Botrytis cinerea T4]|uniref:Uncharacterized protein n=1 Tax=Botryotinia fuckeliana (strain T4) TaxID=999810 RepID=G2Y1I5_BOTF4|nr:hypothetical protein BofuT4_P041360.1 [Botrytis cinerea T4]
MCSFWPPRSAIPKSRLFTPAKVPVPITKRLKPAFAHATSSGDTTITQLNLPSIDLS